MFYECAIYDDITLISTLHFDPFIRILLLAEMNVLLTLLETKLICLTMSHALQNFAPSNGLKMWIIIVNWKGACVLYINTTYYLINVEWGNSVVGRGTGVIHTPPHTKLLMYEECETFCTITRHKTAFLKMISRVRNMQDIIN